MWFTKPSLGALKRFPTQSSLLGSRLFLFYLCFLVRTAYVSVCGTAALNPVMHSSCKHPVAVCTKFYLAQAI
ncbi:hypothetical protein BDV11DRAFT_195512 [Aspergillus similis]